MKDDNVDNTAEYRKQELQIDSLIKAQSIQIKAYAESNFDAPQQDTIKVPYNYIDNSTERGIWYSIESIPTDTTYEYQITNGNSIIFPKAKVKYSVSGLNGDLYIEDAEGSTYELGAAGNPNVINAIWRIAFLPSTIRYNGNNYPVGGLTNKGLKVGSKIQVVTPSYWAFGAQTIGKIPGNTPLVYEFEVLEIN
ncbi:hypothetical protein FM107_08110 [Sphingobacterium sp. JB170]|nr:hypothetical protein FM107_08110 [Sphingobacterium sp. JB170]